MKIFFFFIFTALFFLHVDAFDIPEEHYVKTKTLVATRVEELSIITLAFISGMKKRGNQKHLPAPKPLKEKNNKRKYHLRQP